MASPVFPLATNMGTPVLGNANGSNYTMGDLADENGLVIHAHGIGYAGTLPTTATIFAKGCFFLETDRGSTYTNIGTVAVPVWHLVY